MEKIIKDGKVAVAVSYGYGAGWSTWNEVNPMDARFNKLFLEGEYVDAILLCEELDLGYTGGATDVVIEWIEEGTEFIIEEYDGSEALLTKEEFEWKVA